MEQDEVDVGVLTHQSQNGAVVNVESKQRLANALLQHPHCATFAPSSKMASVLFFFFSVPSIYFRLSLCCFCVLNHSTGSPSAKQPAAQGTRSPAPKVHAGTFLSSGVKVSRQNLNAAVLSPS